MTLIQLFTAIANAIRGKTGSSSSIPAENFPNEISNIETGITPTGTIAITENGTVDVTNYASADVNVSGGTSVEPKDVNLYDFDGTLLASYTKTEFLALNELPENPSHTGLVAQGWNWNLTDAKAHVTDYTCLDIGQMYTTASGLSEFDINLTVSTGLTVNLRMDGTKNWGDGTSDTEISHTYTDYGEYTITCNGTTITNTSSGIFGQGSSRNYYAKKVRLANITNIVQNAFKSCYSLISITIPNTVTSIKSDAFYMCLSLESITIPNTIQSINTSNLFQNCYSLKIVAIPKIDISYGQYMFGSCHSLKSITMSNKQYSFSINNYTFQNCYSLRRMIMPSKLTYIGSGYNFENCYGITEYDFSHHTSVPTLSYDTAFQNINAICKIIVPDNLYNSWRTATNWSTYANYIVKASEAQN